MKILFLNKWHSIIFLMIGMSVIVSCVNEEYDLNKEIDTEMNILKDISLPVGDVDKIYLSEILTLDESEETVISVDEASGDYVFSFIGEDVEADIDIPTLSIGSGGGIHTEPIEVNFNTGAFAGLSASVLTQDIVYSEITGGLLDSYMDIDIDSELPSEIIDVRSVALDASIDLCFSVNTGAVHLKDGFKIVFPDFLHVTSVSSAGISVMNGHEVIVENEIAASAQSPLSIGLTLDKINVPAAAISDGHLILKDNIEVTGDFYLSPEDFSTIPEKVVIDIKAEVKNVDVVSAEVKLALEKEVEGTTFSIADMPDFLSGNDVCLDIYNPTLKVSIENSTPLSFNIMADIIASKGNETETAALGTDPEIVIPAESSETYVISRKESESSDIVIPELGDIISMMPETISFDNIMISSSASDYISVKSNDTYSAVVSYEVYAPLAFDQKMVIAFSQDVEDLGLDLGEGFENVKASMKVENSIPVDFTISAQAIDSEGNVVNDITLAVNKPIAAGSVASPVVTDIELTLNSRSGNISFDGLRLDMKAEAPDDPAKLGIALNKNQGLAIKDIVLNLPDGITLK